MESPAHAVILPCQGNPPELLNLRLADIRAAHGGAAWSLFLELDPRFDGLRLNQLVECLEAAAAAAAAADDNAADEDAAAAAAQVAAGVVEEEIKDAGGPGHLPEVVAQQPPPPPRDLDVQQPPHRATDAPTPQPEPEAGPPPLAEDEEKVVVADRGAGVIGAFGDLPQPQPQHRGEDQQEQQQEQQLPLPEFQPVPQDLQQVLAKAPVPRVVAALGRLAGVYQPDQMRPVLRRALRAGDPELTAAVLERCPFPLLMEAPQLIQEAYRRGAGPGFSQCIRQLADAGFPVLLPFGEGDDKRSVRTLLHWASRAGDLATVRFLLHEQGADPDSGLSVAAPEDLRQAHQKKTRTPLELAVHYASTDARRERPFEAFFGVCRELVDAGARVEDLPLLHHAVCGTAKPEVIEFCVEELEIGVDQPHPVFGCSPLNYMLRHADSPQAARELLRLGADPLLQDARGRTAMCFAARFDRPRTAEALVQGPWGNRLVANKHLWLEQAWRQALHSASMNFLQWLTPRWLPDEPAVLMRLVAGMPRLQVLKPYRRRLRNFAQENERYLERERQRAHRARQPHPQPGEAPGEGAGAAPHPEEHGDADANGDGAGDEGALDEDADVIVEAEVDLTRLEQQQQQHR